MSIVPPLNSTGTFLVKEPYTVDANASYTCIALREFADITKLNTNVYERYYSPYGLAESVYLADSTAGVVIVTLFSPTAGFAYIPSSYITAYPQPASGAFKQRVLSINLGAIPDSLPLADFLKKVASLTSDVVGIEPVVTVHSLNLADTVSGDAANAFESARQARITSRTTERAQLLAAQSENTALRERIELLEQFLLNQ